ncbi:MULTISPECIES: hypothetical protein [unclassified Thioalkalivibrio]|uniref:hypothetical protein n=1 Tax=unclassified Thioalkalivibrio TaxID=2621013 RepID=UPI001E38BD86|nr:MULTISPECIES: hypothetical protein [unclassified Thioalkalivibrio]
MFIETRYQYGQDSVFLRADRVAGIRQWSGDSTSPERSEVFFVGGGETVMVAESASSLTQRIHEAIARKNQAE